MADQEPDADSLTKTTKDDVTLDETALDDVSGGALNAYTKIDGVDGATGKADNKW
jgi:hypothetical protein